jgi:membrane fusion protein (multidrug efflux system)
MKKRIMLVAITAIVFSFCTLNCSKAKKEPAGNRKVDTSQKSSKIGSKAASVKNPKDSKNPKIDKARLKKMKSMMKMRGIDPESDRGKKMLNRIKQGGFGGSGRSRDAGGNTAPLVKIEEVKKQVLKSFITLNGKVEPERSVKIYSRLSTYVKKIKKEEDEYVKKGTVIAILDDTEIKIKYNQAKNQLKQAEFSYQTEKDKFKRSEELIKEELISEENFQSAKSSFTNSKIEYENKLENFKDLELQLAYTKIKSPIDGYIIERLIDIGTKVNANQEIYTVEDFSPLLIKLYVPAADAINIQKQMKVEIRSDLFITRVFQGKVKLINPRIDPESGTIKVTVEVFESDRLLKPGMFVEAKVLISHNEDKIAIPTRSIVHKKGLAYIYLFKMGKVKEILIKTGITQDEMIEVTEGIKVGDRIVTVGVEDLKDGSSVRVKK